MPMPCQKNLEREMCLRNSNDKAIFLSFEFLWQIKSWSMESCENFGACIWLIMPDFGPSSSIQNVRKKKKKGLIVVSEINYNSD